MAPESAWLAFECEGEERTELLGRLLAERLVAGDVVALDGELGAGKTCFVRGLAEGLGARGPVSSPTFTLMHEYDGPLPLRHLDAWMAERGTSYLRDGGADWLRGDGVCAVEWAERIANWLPAERFEVRLEHRGPTARAIRLRWTGPQGRLEGLEEGVFTPKAPPGDEPRGPARVGGDSLKGHWDAERDPLVALHNGDPAPFEEFVRSEVGTLIAFFVHLGAERSEAEDLSQETFVKLYKSATHYEPRAAFSSFALRVARNAWIDRRRRAAVRPSGVSLDAQEDSGSSAPLRDRLSAPASDVLALASLSEDRARLRVAIAQLPDAHAAVFELAVLRELPYASVAQTLGIPIGTVKSRVFHALRKLREFLEAREA